MDESLFSDRLHKAAARVIDLTRRIIVEELADDYQFVVIPSASHDDTNILDDIRQNAKGLTSLPEFDYEMFRDSSFVKGCKLGPFDPTDTIAYLFRDGKSPLRITMTVGEAASSKTTLFLKTSAIVTTHEHLLAYPLEISPLRPFICASPGFPPWVNAGVDGCVDKKFPLLWQKECWDPYLGFASNDELDAPSRERRERWRRSQERKKA